MHRKGHLIGATLFWGIAIALYFVLGNYTSVTEIDFTRHAMWIVLSFIACHFGAQLPDYDLLSDRFLPHRNFVTHSFIVPLLICIPIFFVTYQTRFLVPIFAMFLVGHGSHLLLDLNPESWQGTALIHIWWNNDDGKKTLSEKNSKIVLFANGLIILAVGIILLYFFNTWITLNP